jgi:DNA-binding response OmpR family regulator
MAYFEKQKFNILELVLRKDSPRKILLVEPEYYLRVLLKNLLEKENFLVASAEKISESKLILEFFEPDIAVISPHSEKDLQVFLLGLSDLRKQYQTLRILTVGHRLPVEAMKKIMDLGVSSHLERALTKPHDIAAVIKTLF